MRDSGRGMAGCSRDGSRRLGEEVLKLSEVTHVGRSVTSSRKVRSACPASREIRVNVAGTPSAMARFA